METVPMPPGWLSHHAVRLLEGAGTNAHRIYTGPDAWVERLGEDVLISHKTPEALARVLEDLEHWDVTVIRRVFARLLARHQPERQSPVLVRGDAGLPMETVVSESGLRYGMDFAAGYSVGLFLDQRANRDFLRRTAPRSLLNTFAYTCSFSVAAAAAGAQTVSIDLSGKSLRRGKANFALNQLDLAGHRFLADDTLEVLPRLARRKETFDAIILDPPTFSRSARGRRWQVEEHFGDLLHQALQVAGRRAMILLSTNCTTLDMVHMERMARGELRVAARQGKLQRTPTLPDFPGDTGALTAWLMLD